MVFISFSYKHDLASRTEALIIVRPGLKTEARTISQGASS